MSTKSTLAAVFAATASAHMCALSPLQRGGADGAQYAGNNTCLQVTGPCGPAPAANPVASFFPGQKIDITLEKNLDHFYAANPGNFSAYLWDSKGNSMFLAATPDSAAPSLSLYELISFVPKDAAAGQYILQTIYWPNNPTAPGAFYQCSDISILSAPVQPTEAELAAAREHCKEHM